MARPRYKITEIGEIPQEWEISKLSKIFKIFTGTTPSTKIGKYWYNGSVEWLTPKDLSRMADTIILPPSERKITPEAVKQFGLNLIPEESILISTRAPVGYVGINKIKITFNQGCKGLVPIEHGSNDSSFYAYYLKYIRNFLVSVSGGSTFKELSKERLASLDVPIPPLSEQQKIAEILSTADYAIQRVDEQITLSESLKKGLMQTLLTKGIGHTKFKMTEIGEIPEEWEVKNLIDLVDNNKDIVGGPFGSNLKVSDYKTEGVPIIRLQNVERNMFIDKDIKYISFQKADELKYHSFKTGDILLAKLGDPIGKSCIVPEKMASGIVVADVVRIRISPKKAVKEFVLHLLNSSLCIEQLRNQVIGSTRPRVNITEVRELKIICPKHKEQQKIAEILLTVDKKLEHLKGRRDHLEKLKKVLMNDLLNGKVRVKIEPSRREN